MKCRQKVFLGYYGDMECHTASDDLACALSTGPCCDPCGCDGITRLAPILSVLFAHGGWRMTNTIEMTKETHIACLEWMQTTRKRLITRVLGLTYASSFLEFQRNSIDMYASATITPRLRQDFLCWMDQALVLCGEEKSRRVYGHTPT